MSTTTPNFDFTLPGVNNPVDKDIWGGQLNMNFTSLDTFLTGIDSANIGSSAPVIPVTDVSAAGMMWLNNSSGVGGIWNLQIYDGTNWVSVGMLDTLNHVYSTGGTVSLNIQTFSAIGAATYTPSFGMSYCIVEVWGAGGGSGSSVASPTSSVASGGGGGGGYVKQIFKSAQIGASQPLFIGTGGLTGTPNGGKGGNSTFGAGLTLLTAGGGLGSLAGVASPSLIGGLGASGGTATGGFLNVPGDSGGNSLSAFAPNPLAFGGNGGGTATGGITPGGSTVTNPFGVNGTNGVSFGSGAGGSCGITGGASGGVGANGAIIITEYI